MSWEAPERLGAPDFPTLGWQVIDWIEAYLVHGPGDVAGDPIILDDEFATFVCHAYRLSRSGRRVYRRGVLSRPKGRAKSELGGMLVCAEFLGPVRFGGWDSNGEPVGVPVQSPFIRCLATEETQAGNTFDNVHYMLSHLADTFPEEFGSLDVGLTRVLRSKGDKSGGEIRPSTASASAKDGGKETFAVADETHLYTTSELKGMHRTVMRNLAKRKAAEPWMLDTTTMFGIGENSVAEESFESRSAGVLIDHRQALEVEDIYDTAADEQILEALTDVYGPAAEWMDLTRILEEMRDPSELEGNARRYFLNQRHEVGSPFVSFDEFVALADASTVVADGELITLGFDGSTTGDHTALVGCRVSDGFLFVIDVWEPGGGRIDRRDVDATMRATFERWNVWRLYADPPHWQDYLDKWTAELEADRVIEWWTNRRSAMSRALERFMSGVADSGLSHDGDSRLVAAVRNARLRQLSGHFRIEKEHATSPKKIDAAMAAVLAFEARGDAVAAGVLNTKKRSGRLVTF